MRYLAATCLLLASLSASAANTTPEEAAVRNAYAKLAFAVDVNTAYRAVLANPKISSTALAKQVELKGLRFKLSDFTVGDLSSVASLRYKDVFGQYPDGQDVITTTVDTENFGEGPEDKPVTVSTETAIAEWTAGPFGNQPDYTVAKMLPIMEHESGVSPLLRYCTYTVTATLGERSRTYQAEFFFGPNGQAAPGDVVVGLGGGALEHFINHPVFPNILLQTSLWGKSAALRSFVLTNQKTKASCKAGDACCNAATLQCGVYSADVIGRQP
jgi:hypothetical protein